MPDEPIVGAAAVHGVLTGWRQMLQGDAAAPGASGRRPSRGVEARVQRLLNLVAAIAFTIGGQPVRTGRRPRGARDRRPDRARLHLLRRRPVLQHGRATRPCCRPSTRPGATGWRWWAWEPERVEWVSAALLFAGTIVFGVNLADSFIQGLTAKQENRLIWAPDMVGCALFIVSGHLALSQICRRRVCWKPRQLDWWIAVLNQVGSYLFLISALAAFTNPQTSNVVNEAVANWGTFAGALCFAIGGVLQGVGGLATPRQTRSRPSPMSC